MSTRRNDSRFRSGECGNAFYIILIGIFLFGALMFAFSRGARQGAGNLTQKQAQLAADDIMTFAQQIQRAVDRVYSDNCSENEINFDQTLDPGYTNPNAPADKHCNIFDPAGGAVTYRTVPYNANDGSPWIFTGSNNVQGSTFGTASPDLVFLLQNVDPLVCAQLNKALQITGAPAEIATVNTTKYIGTFTATDQIGSGDGARAECTTVGGNSRFYSVLMER